MKERLSTWFNRIKTFWTQLSKKNKGLIIGGSAVILVAIILILLLTNIKHYSPLYSGLSESEAGQIKDTLDSKKVPYKLSDGGTTISVPKEQVDQLKVELASQGIPKTGQIDYSFFGQNAGFGITDKQFDVLQRAAMQTELANLISNTKGVKSAKVMITLPQNDVWVSGQDKNSEASASIVLNVAPGSQLSSEQVNGLYHLVSKSVPNLPVNNIVIMDQYFNYYDLKNNESNGSTLSAYNQQQSIIRDIESNVQRRVTQMLTMMMGEGKVMVNVSAAVDFTQSKEKQDLVEPVNQQTMEGLQTSTEHIAETYTGQGAQGQAGTGTTDVPTYQNGASGNGTYQKVEDRVNNEFNRIHREVVNSPYKVTDLGIQVMIEPPNANNNNSLSAQRVNDVRQILNSIIKTSISDPQGQELTNAAINQKTSVTVGRFNGKAITQPQSNGFNWLYIVGGVLLALVIGLILWMAIRRRRNAEENEDEQTIVQDIPQPEDYEAMLNQENPEQKKYNELEKMARQKPDQFVKLLRSWMAEDK
ncbi:flagellar basal-body MS-ring/collar protein FliF [Sporolactobacillus laevolacticus]|uniref:Flagellar M-ring protein n=1 Tax=Sporolactobacillus laevolacticus DSM 442 TaxID=1395513 RepID=V6IZQ7_9BACL|nr:flagellar basal-body MS-ring/collar protein FliF [Sporolactobacillus laevolacticus]EST13073.1 flagellar MS-ring protein [Sporolactobacillus laevolacticus DSM 442]